MEARSIKSVVKAPTAYLPAIDVDAILREDYLNAVCDFCGCGFHKKRSHIGKLNFCKVSHYKWYMAGYVGKREEDKSGD